MNNLKKLSIGLFWDIEADSLDLEHDSDLIIMRVLTRGTWEDWKILKELYPVERIKQASLNARYLDKKTMMYCSTIFSIQIDKFRCYTMKQLIPEPWNY
jgi:hypothetical protein